MATKDENDAALLEKKFCEIFDRLRETEAQTREQNTRIGALCDRIEAFSAVTDKFFELEDKRHKADDERFANLVEHEKRLSTAADTRYKEMLEVQQKREEKFWKALSILIGAVLALALGPKLCKEVYSAFTGSPAKVAYMTSDPIYPAKYNYQDIWCDPKRWVQTFAV